MTVSPIVKSISPLKPYSQIKTDVHIWHEYLDKRDGKGDFT